MEKSDNERIVLMQIVTPGYSSFLELLEDDKLCIGVSKLEQIIENKETANDKSV